MLTVLAGVAALVGAAIAALLLVPVRIDVDVDVDIHDDADPAAGAAAPAVRTRARWLFLALEWPDHRVARAARPPSDAGRPQRRKPGKPTRSKARRGGALAVVRAVLGTPGFAGRVRRLAGDLVRILAPREVDVRGRFGLDDPAATGAAAGAILGWMRARGAAWRVRLEPDFSGPVLAGHAHVAWSVRAGSILWPVLTFAGSPVVWRAARAALRAR